MTAWGSLLAASDTAAILKRAISEQDFETADRCITEAISRILLAPAESPIPDTILDAPDTTGSERYDTLLATGFAFALAKRGEASREWMLRAPALSTEWLWDGDNAASTAFRDFIRRNTPAIFLSKNILLRERDLVAP